MILRKETNGSEEIYLPGTAVCASLPALEAMAQDRFLTLIHPWPVESARLLMSHLVSLL